MNGADQDLDRNLPATPFKLSKARDKGSVARSPDVPGVALVSLAIVWCYVMAGPMLMQWAGLHARWWDAGAWRALDHARAATLVNDALLSAAYLLAPLLGAVMLVSVLSNFLQTGPVLSAEPLKPDFNRLNPAQGFKRLFSLKTVYTAGKSVFKLALLAVVFWWALQEAIGQLLVLPGVPPKAYLLQLPGLMGGLLSRLWLVLLVLAVLDFAYMRWDFAREMRMSQRELKDEAKHREGDPRIRRRLRELRVEMLRRTQALRKVPSADVLITNPTRVAVALKYDRARGAAPTLVAKGAGGLARQMRELAWRHGVTVVQNPPLARSLYRHVELDAAVPPTWYATVAKILVWVYAARQQRTAATGRPA